MSDSPAPQHSEEALASAGARSETSLTSEGNRAEESLTFSGQRRINLMWEGTQRLIALGVMCTFLATCLAIVVGELLGRPEVEMPPSLAGVVGYVIGSYFARTNHEKTGGVGVKPTGAGVGR